MTKNTKIEWADHTFNPWIGCTKVSPACDNCYAENMMDTRLKIVKWGAGQERKRTSESNWQQPLKWNKEAKKLGVRHRVFCASLADVFDNEVPAQWRRDLFALIASTPYIDWLLLTKRIGNAERMMSEMFLTGRNGLKEYIDFRKNIWIGATICNQDEADRDIPKLLAVPAAKRFLSMEPLLGHVDVFSNMTGELLHTSGDDYAPGWLDWIIVGGESGNQARPMHPEWVRSLREQCTAADVPFFFKQHGEWLATDFCDDDMAMIPSKRTVYVRVDGSFHDGSEGVDLFGGEEESAWVGKKSAGRVLDGREWDEVPA